VQRFRGGLVFKAHRLFHHSILGLRVKQKKKKAGRRRSNHSETGSRIHFFFFTLVTGPRRSVRLKLRDTTVYEPQIRARLGTTAHLCKVVVHTPEVEPASGTQEGDPLGEHFNLSTWRWHSADELGSPAHLTLNPKPETRNPTPEIQNPQP